MLGKPVTEFSRRRRLEQPPATGNSTIVMQTLNDSILGEKDWAMLNERSVSRLLPLTLAALLALASVTSATASAPVAASGTNNLKSCDFTSQRTVGTNTIVTGTCYVTWTGTFAGTDVAQATVTFHADGSAHGNAVDTFTGTV